MHLIGLCIPWKILTAIVFFFPQNSKNCAVFEPVETKQNGKTASMFHQQFKVLCF